MSLAQGWDLARAWFHDPRQAGWRRPPLGAMADLATRHGLGGPFWELDRS